MDFYASDLFIIFVIVVLLLYPSASAICCRVLPSERMVQPRGVLLKKQMSYNKIGSRFGYLITKKT